MLDGSAGELSVSVDLQDSASQFAGWKDMGSRRFLLLSIQQSLPKKVSRSSQVAKGKCRSRKMGRLLFCMRLPHITFSVELTDHEPESVCCFGSSGLQRDL